MPQGDVWNAIRAAVAGHVHRPVSVDGRARAAVLIPLAPYQPDPRVVLTVRSHEVEHHKGEISFPGGAADPSDPDLRHTALRESHEEVGVAPAQIDVLGELSPYVTRTGFHITPFVGVLDHAPYIYEPSPREVAEVLEVPLSHLLHESSWEARHIVRNSEQIVMRSYRWGDHLIYGATAMMLRAFLADVVAQLGLEH